MAENINELGYGVHANAGAVGNRKITFIKKFRDLSGKVYD